jgi:adenosylcobyric acid synthase
MPRSPAAVMMVQGTASHVGKSTLVTALCRMLRQDGFRVAPFKAQNMALNSYVAVEGGEIGRAQAVQAEAAGVEPSLLMNPILLKPEADARAQVIVNGRVQSSMSAAEYQRRKLTLWPVVVGALDRLRAECDVVVVEGAGSPAEINLRDTDLANMRVALHTRAPVLLVGDIDRGGVFASLLGTLELLAVDERELVRGFVINKFRGDPSILAPGLTFLEQRTGVPVVGVLPHLPDLDLPEEDSLGLDRAGPTRATARLDIAIIRLPRIANFDDFDALAAEPSVALRYVESARDLDDPDLVVIPGSKSTVADLHWLREAGLAAAILRRAAAGGPIVGVCGGFQMLGRRILDPHGMESPMPSVDGLGLLPVETAFATEKRTCRVRARVLASIGPFGSARGSDASGYEIHTGKTTVDPGARSSLAILERSGARANDPDGVVSQDGLILGTYIHGLLIDDTLRHALVSWLLGRKGLPSETAPRRFDRQGQYDRLAEAVRAALDVEALKAMCRLP